MTNTSISLLSDRELLDATARMVDRERRTTAELIALLAELDARRLYLGESYSSLFAYCTRALHLSEPAAYSRIAAARAVRRFPVILALLADGAITLTTIGLLAPHLTDENHEGLLEASRHKSKRDVERLVACLHPQPDIPSSVRKLPVATETNVPILAIVERPSQVEAPVPEHSAPGAQHSARSPRPVIAPLAPERYLLRITMSGDTRDKLERARDLLRHAIPNGDPAAIVDRALTVLIEQLERTKVGATRRPRRSDHSGTTRSRRVPAAVKRAVWARDEGRCAFVGKDGRCAETGFLEFHHVRPWAAGGATDVENLQLRCRAHNGWEAERWFGRERSRSAAPASQARRPRQLLSTPSGQS